MNDQIIYVNTKNLGILYTVYYYCNIAFEKKNT